MARVKITRKETQKKQKAVSVDDRKNVMHAIESNVTYKPIIYTMIGMGLCIGETIALKWDDIDFNNNTISINKAAKCTPEINNEEI